MNGPEVGVILHVFNGEKYKATRNILPNNEYVLKILQKTLRDFPDYLSEAANLDIDRYGPMAMEVCRK